MKRIAICTMVLTVALLAMASLATAAVPQTINYQGRLVMAGEPVTANLHIVFTIYDAENGGNSKWTETHPSVEIVDGLFNVVLGDGTPPEPIDDTVFSGGDRWLEIVVAGETIIPRAKLASNPYAFQSNWTRVGNVLYASSSWGIARSANTLYGDHSHTHVNLGVSSTTGELGEDRYYCAVGGGFLTTASGQGSAVGGGAYNTASGAYSAVGCGNSNTAGDTGSVVSGGVYNTANGVYSTVPGGRNCEASGRFSFASGRRAKANHNGSFVWADTTNEDFYSSASNQFKVRARGGTYFDQTNPSLNYGFMVGSSDWDFAGRFVNLEVDDSVAQAADMLQIKVASNSHDGIQFIECERGSDVEFRVWGDGDVTADGVFTPGGADFAELVEVASGHASVEAGDVLVINPNNIRSVAKSSRAHSTLVAGIYSTQPGILASSHEWDEVAADLGLSSKASDDEEVEAEAYRVLGLAAMLDEVPLAVVGIVPCKVSAENGSIQPGDLLVTSDTPGHAMRDDNPKVGTILGKALGSLSSGTGTIEVLVTLQ